MSKRRLYYRILVGGEYRHRLWQWTMALTTLIVLAGVATVMLAYQVNLSPREFECLWLFDLVASVLFGVEYGLRFWCCVEEQPARAHWRMRLRYAVSPLGLLDLLAFLPFLLDLFVPLGINNLRLVRVMLLFKIILRMPMLGLFLLVLKREAIAFLSLILTELVLMLMAAIGMLTLEQPYQPQVFNSLGDALWWAVVTMTTVGYGDIYPVTMGGKLLGGLMMLLGVAMVALPAGLLAARFSDELAQRRELHIKQQNLMSATGRARGRKPLGDWMAEQNISQTELEQWLSMRKMQEFSKEEGVRFCPCCGQMMKSEKSVAVQGPDEA